MRVCLSKTESEWKQLFEIASSKYPGKDFSFFITQQLSKSLRDVELKEYVEPEEPKKNFHYRPPSTLAPKISQIARRKKIAPATVIAMLALNNHII